MFNKDKISFEENSVLVDCVGTSRQEIINCVYAIAKEIVETLNIANLNSIRIKDIDLFDSVFGSANIHGNIILSYSTAVNLSKKEDLVHKRALSTIWHEFYHLFDYENVGQNIFKRVTKNNSDKLAVSFMLWSEFFATYKTYEIYEVTDFYDSFECVFTNDGDLMKKKYYTSRIFAYYINCNHSPKCDRLIEEHFNRNYVVEIVDKYIELLYRYPNITEVDLIEIDRLIGLLVDKKFDFEELQTIDLGLYIKNKN